MKIVILTGAGISAESGLATFRGSDGLWCGHRVEDVATPEAFERNPALVHEFYNLRRAQLHEVEPNTAHHALAKLMREIPSTLLVTQNVDNLHDRAHTSSQLIHLHGELTKGRCNYTEEVFDFSGDMSTELPCPCCKRKGAARPHIVWFGEMPLEMERIQRALFACELFLSIGTSGNVYPAAGFVQMAKMAGAKTVELNLEPSAGSHLFDETHYGPATEIVPAYVETLVNQASGAHMIANAK